MINRVVLEGRLTKDVDIRNTQSGTAVASFILAVNRQFKDANGERQADFISCVAWRKTAEILGQYTSKGSMIGVDGRIQTRTYDDKNGQRVYVTEVVVENISFLETRNSQRSTNASSVAQATGSINQRKAPDPFANSNETIDVSDDDLPF